jgi:hypothetical protein
MTAAGISPRAAQRCVPGRGAANIRAAVLAPRRRGVQVVGQARRAGLGRRRVTKHNLALSGHDGLVRQDGQEIDDSREDDSLWASGTSDYLRAKFRTCRVWSVVLL